METAAIFSIERLSNPQGIGKVNVMVDLICIGLLELQGARCGNKQMKKSCPQRARNHDL